MNSFTPALRAAGFAVCASRARRLWLSILVCIIWMATVSPVMAGLSVTPITWDVVGLNHNRPLTLGPNLFPVAARVCNESGAGLADIDVNFVWPDGAGNNWNDGQPGTGDAFINLRPESLTSLHIPMLDDEECLDAYFEIQITRATNAFGNTRPYRIEARDSDEVLLGSTPDFRQIYIEELIRQNRNEIVGLRFGEEQDGSDWQDIAGGGTVALVVGETYYLEKTTHTATGYEQLESFIALSNTLFRIHSVETEYEQLSFGAQNRIPQPHSQLWADACIWQSDTQSPNYRSCMATGKAGGEVRTVYEIEILSGGGSTVMLTTLIYDVSGGSYHYNADFDTPIELRNAVIVDPADAGFSKRFLPSTIAGGGVSTLRFTITNPNPAQISGYNFVDNLPAGVEVADSPNASSSCGGNWNPVPFDTSLSFSDGTIAANSSCTVTVDVTAAAEGSYLNVSENLFIGDTDSGQVAEATLNVTDGPLPPACVPGTELARWTMDPSQGTTVPPQPFDTHPAVAVAASSFQPLPSLPGQNDISTSLGNPPNSWRGTGWGVATNPSTAGPGPGSPSYFEFEVDTSAFASDPSEPLTFSIDVNPTPTGNWATPSNITTNVHASADGGAFATFINANPIERSVWTTLTGSVTPGVDNTRFRVNISGRSSGNSEATFLIDNIVISGCGPGDPAEIPDPPELSKSFAPNPIASGATSTLTFVVSNPNSDPADNLTGISFADELPPGMQVAATPNASSTCGPSVQWSPASGDVLLELSGGSLAAGTSCTAQVDVTSTAVGASLNVSDLIYASESGQNATSSGYAVATLDVLAPPVIAKQFVPELVLLGVTPDDASTLTLTIANPNPNHAISGVAFEDDLPGDLVVAPGPNASASGCGTPVWNPPPGSGLLQFSAGSISAGSTCTLTVDVTGPAGNFINETDPVSHEVAGVTALGNVAQASLVIDEPIPGLRMRKQISPGGPAPEPGESEADIWPWSDYLAVAENDDIYYLLIIENIGELALSNVAISDSNLPVDPVQDCVWPDAVGSLDVADVDGNHIAMCLLGPVAAAQGETTNIAQAVSDQAEDCTDDPTTLPPRCLAIYGTTGLSIVKTADPVTYDQVGDIIEYEFLVSNTGFAILNGPVMIDDDLVSDEACPDLNTIGNLDNFFDPGEQITCTASYEITPADVSSGSVTNIAFAFTPDAASDTDDATVTLVGTDPGLTVVKELTSAPDPIEVGSVLTYTVTATNTGDVTLNNVVVSDNLIDPPSTSCATLTVGAECVLTGTYTVTQADVDAGQISNTGAAVSDEVTDPEEDTLVTPIDQAPGLGVNKALTDAPSPIEVGSVLEYTITATNTGNVTLTSVVVSDAMLTPSSENCASVAPAGTCVLVGTYTVTQSDVDAGEISNTGLANSDETGPEEDTVVTPIGQDPALSVLKEVTDAPDPIVEGSVLEYTITATNSGNVTLNNVVVSDDLIDPSSTSCPTVAPGDTCQLVGTYTVTQADVDEGEISNTGAANSDETDPEEDTVVTPIGQDPALSVLKELTDAPDPIEVGSVLEYTITATNTGNVSLSNVEVSDDLIDPSSITCMTLAVGADCVLTGTYTVTQADIDNGQIVNTGSAVSDEVTDPVEDTVITPIDQAPALSLLKEAELDDANGNGFADAGEVIDYTLTATNTGNVTLSDVVIIDDLLDDTPDGLECVPAQPATLEPGESLVCTGSYTVSQADVDAGEDIVNEALASAPDPTDPSAEVSDEDSTTTPIVPTEALIELDKQVTAGDPYANVGDVIEYLITATNTGNVTLFDVTITDPDASLNTCTPAQPAELAPGESLVCEASYVVTQADINAGSFTNVASVTATDPDSEAVGDSDEATASAAGVPALSVAKELTDAPEPIVEGSVLTYTVVATNAGNVTLNNVIVSDDLIDPSSTTCPSVAPGDTCQLTGTYTVTQADVDAGQIVNTGTANSDETGEEGDTVTTPIDQAPALSVAKATDRRASPDPIVDTCQLIGRMMSTMADRAAERRGTRSKTPR
jgi:uncharacterized repeat protein (TIGR01451 family)